MSTFEIETKCPNCNYITDSHTSAMGIQTKPKPGDFSICLNCGLPCVFDDNLNLKEANLDSMDLSEKERFMIDELISVHKDMKRQGLLDLESKNK